jgi:hypothetical protein
MLRRILPVVVDAEVKARWHYCQNLAVSDQIQTGNVWYSGEVWPQLSLS